MRYGAIYMMRVFARRVPLVIRNWRAALAILNPHLKFFEIFAAFHDTGKIVRI